MKRPHTKLTDDDVRQIWAWRREGAEPWRILLRLKRRRQKEVSRQVICNILHGRSFADLQAPHAAAAGGG